MPKKQISENGTTFYCNANSVYDIDIEPGVKSVKLSLPNRKVSVFNVIHLTKVFEDVEELIIGEDVTRLKLSNRLFPNVRKVISLNDDYISGSCIVSVKYGCNTLHNTFCLKPDEVLDLSGVHTIDRMAFDGCRSRNIINADGVSVCERRSFEGSAFEQSPCRDGILTLGHVLAKADYSRKILEIPSEIRFICQKIDLNRFKKIIIHDDKTINKIYKYRGCIVLADEVKLTHPHLAFNQAEASAIEVSDGNEKYRSDDGILYSKDGRKLIRCPQGKDGDVIIPEGCEKIGSNGFFNCHVKHVTTPASLKVIDIGAFSSSALKSIELNEGLLELPEYSFNCCADLTEISIPSTVKNIGEYAFYGCIDLQTIHLNEGLKTIQAFAFNTCTSLKRIDIPASVNYVGKNSMLYADEIHLRGAIPKNFIGAITASFVYDYAAPSVYVTSPDRNMHIPRFFRSQQKKEIVKNFDRYAEQHMKFKDVKDKYLQTLFRESNCSKEERDDIVLSVYRDVENPVWNLKLYLKRASKDIGIRLLDSCDTKYFLDFLKLGLIPKSVLKDLLDYASKIGDAISAGYILNEINNVSDSKEEEKKFVL